MNQVFQLERQNSQEKINLADNQRSHEATLDPQSGEQVFALWNQE